MVDFKRIPMAYRVHISIEYISLYVYLLRTRFEDATPSHIYNQNHASLKETLNGLLDAHKYRVYLSLRILVQNLIRRHPTKPVV